MKNDAGIMIMHAALCHCAACITYVRTTYVKLKMHGAAAGAFLSK